MTRSDNTKVLKPGRHPVARRRRAFLGGLPTEDEWFKALMEWWTTTPKGADMQVLFNKPIEQVSPQLAVLAGRLNEVCRTDEKMALGAFLRFQEWQRTEVAGRAKGALKHAALFVDDVTEPANYNYNYEVEFHAHNSTQDKMLINRMRIEVIEAHKIKQHPLKTPGHPGERFTFAAHIAAGSRQAKLSPTHANRHPGVRSAIAGTVRPVFCEDHG